MALRIAIEGCGHGTLNAIYGSVEQSCKAKGWDGVDCLIIGGDFQAVRNAQDMNCLAVPPKYRQLGDFHEYYSGVRKAPYLTIFVGGNHEASNYLLELYYGGWVAPNIYYLGAANVIRLGSLRIAALSGIWKGYSYRRPHYERLPFNQDDIKSIYHVRELDTRKLLQVQGPVDVGISHDWPQGIEWKGDWRNLFRKKRDFRADAEEGRLGSVAAKLVLERLKPAYWFSAHLHIKYAAIINFESSADSFQEQVGATASPFDNQGPPWYPTSANPNDTPLGVNARDRGFAATNTDQKSYTVHNPDEIPLDLDDIDVVKPHHGSGETDKQLSMGQNSLRDNDHGVNTRAAEDGGLENGDDVDSDTSDGGVPLTESYQVSEVADRSPNVGKASLQDDDPSDTQDDLGFSRKTTSDLPSHVLAQPSATSHSGVDDTNAEQKLAEIPAEIPGRVTRFLSLDKCLPGRDFLQLMEITPLNKEKTERPLSLEYDREWLAITRVFAGMLVWGDPSATLPHDKGEASNRLLIAREEAWVEENLVKTGKMRVPENFEKTAPTFDPSQDIKVGGQPREYNNPQTRTFCELLQIVNPFDAAEEEIEARVRAGMLAPKPSSAQPNGGWRLRQWVARGSRENQGNMRGRGSARGRGYG